MCIPMDPNNRSITILFHNTINDCVCFYGCKQKGTLGKADFLHEQILRCLDTKGSFNPELCDSNFAFKNETLPILEQHVLT